MGLGFLCLDSNMLGILRALMNWPGGKGKPRVK